MRHNMCKDKAKPYALMFARSLEKSVVRHLAWRGRQRRASHLQETKQIQKAYWRDQAQVELPEHLVVIHGLGR